MSQVKTNVRRILEQHKIEYKAHTYPHGKDTGDGVTVANLLNQNSDHVFNTLVARGKTGQIYVFVIPVAEEFDLKKAAKSVSEKSIELTAVKELLNLTGYIRGGCSPVGLKKPYKITIHETANNIPTIMVSAGKIGMQIELNPLDLIKLVNANTADLICK